jgi:CspA family cold shock protein
MGKKGRDRGPRRREFDDDTSGVRDTHAEPPRQPFRKTPREDATPTGPAIDATVKWFNADKGFGFVELGDGSGDAFLHIAVLQNAGHDVVGPESRLRVQVGQGQKGRQVTAVLEVDTTGVSAPQPSRRSSPNTSGRGRADPSTASEVEGTVKWFNPDKGFGFAVVEDGGKDVFIHISVVEKAGIRVLPDGRRVSMQVVKTQKGREAISLSLINWLCAAHARRGGQW